MREERDQSRVSRKEEGRESCIEDNWWQEGKNKTPGSLQSMRAVQSVEDYILRTIDTLT